MITSNNNEIRLSGQVLLTSAGFLNLNIERKCNDVISQEFKKNSAIIITSASIEKENNKYNILVFNQLKSLGFKNVNFVDVEKESLSLEGVDLLWVNGGNTFRLLKALKDSNFLEQLLGFSGFYIGVSAGSVVLGPNIEIAKIADENTANINDFSGFNIVNFTVFPHYENINDYEEAINEFENKHNVKVERLRNNEAIYMKDGVFKKWQ